MRIAVVTSSPPMTDGGHMVIARCLVHALRDHGHDADLIVCIGARFDDRVTGRVAGVAPHAPNNHHDLDPT